VCTPTRQSARRQLVGEGRSGSRPRRIRALATHSPTFALLKGGGGGTTSAVAREQGARAGRLLCSKTRGGWSWTSLAGAGQPGTRDGSLADLPRRAETATCGRGGARSPIVHAAQVPPLRPLVHASRPPRRFYCPRRTPIQFPTGSGIAVFPPHAASRQQRKAS